MPTKACPFLSQPRMRRNEKDLPEHLDAAGIMLRRNPGVDDAVGDAALQAVQGRGGVLFNVGDPHRVEFYAEGRPPRAMRSWPPSTSGMPIAARDGRARRP